MRENTIRTIWQSGGAVINGWLHIASGFAAELMAHQGWDGLTIDMQHGPVDYQAALGMLQAIATTSVIPTARVPWNEPGIIGKMLDAGCYGIICPMVNTREDCERFVGACRYPPLGYRSSGPTRARLYAGQDYTQHANTTVITMAMIETKQAVENLDAILTTPGLDSIYIGPADLSQSYGYPPAADISDPFLLDVQSHIIASARQHGIVAGIHVASTDYAFKMIDAGCQFITLLADSRLLASAASAAVATMKGRKVEQKVQGPY